jgi:hypothetical protein
LLLSGRVPLRGELDRLHQQLRENLRLHQVHPEVRHLRLVEEPANCVRPDRAGDLLGACCRLYLPGANAAFTVS